jgi:O-antigen/teichoic acid export membrane protein
LREQADRFVVGLVNGEAMVGLYIMAKEFALLPSGRVSAIANTLSGPVMAELQNDIEAMRSTFMRVVRLVASVNFPICFGFLLVAKYAVLILLGSKWLMITPIVQAFCVYSAFRSLDILFPPILMARHRTDFMMRYTALLLIVMPLIYFIGARWWGPLGVVIISTPIYFAAVVCLVLETLRTVHSSINELLRELWRPLVASSVMACSVIAVEVSAAEWLDQIGPVSRLLLLSMTGAAAYAAALMVVARRTMDELWELLGWTLRRVRT